MLKVPYLTQDQYQIAKAAIYTVLYPVFENKENSTLVAVTVPNLN